MSIIRLVINELIMTLKKYRSNRNLITRLNDYLVPGKYATTLSFDCIYNLDRRNNLGNLTFSSYSKQTALGKNIIKLFNRIFTYSVKKGQKSFRGTEVIISSSLTEYKIFDFEQQRVLTFFHSLEKLKRIQDNKNKFRGVLPMPMTISINESMFYTIEELIMHQEFSINDSFFFLCNNTNLVLNKRYIRLDDNSREYRKACDLFARRFGSSKLLDNSIGEIKCITHGDLWSSNIIYNGEAYYITDFERVGERYFLFDIFTFMFTEWLLKGDSQLIDNYFSGDYDKHFKNFFHYVNISYNEKNRQEYFLAFLVSITYERWQKYSGIDRRIKAFLNNYITSY